MSGILRFGRKKGYGGEKAFGRCLLEREKQTLEEFAEELKEILIKRKRLTSIYEIYN